MFSSTTLNPFIPSSSSSHADLSPYIFHHQEPFLLHHHLENHVSISPLISETTCNLQPITNSMCSSVINGDFVHEDGFGTASCAEKRPKKDRHSKIYTAQGLRDRRVRMSIEIARKFFDLQDLLGFDKASQTVDWLLTKSKKAISDLSHKDNRLINYSTESLSLDSICEENGELELEKDNNLNLKDVKKIKRTTRKKKKLAVNVHLNAKELREKARARARERTRFKMLSSNAKFSESRNNLDPTFHQNLNQSKSTVLNQHHIYHHQNQCQQSSPASYLRPCYHLAEEEEPNYSSSTIGEESILIKRNKLKQSTVMNYQQNFILFKDENNFPNLHPNWDHNNSASTSTMNI